MFIVARKKINYRFHNPNTVETTADYILKVFMEVNEKRWSGRCRRRPRIFWKKITMAKNERFWSRSPLVLLEKTR